MRLRLLTAAFVTFAASACMIQNKNKASLAEKTAEPLAAEALPQETVPSETSTPETVVTPEVANPQAETKPVSALPLTLKELAITNEGKTFLPNASLIPYTVESPLWSDGAVKSRFIKIPDGTHISLDASRKTFVFPAGTLLVKNFAADDANATPIETRVMLLQADGTWAFATYQWMTDASTQRTTTLDPVKIASNTLWPSGYRIPSEEECVKCHKESPSEVNGFQPDQVLSSLPNLVAAKLLSAETEKQISEAGILPRANPKDDHLNLKDRALAYLDINCGQCHRPEGVNSYLQLNKENINIEWLQKKSYLVSGNPESSTIWKRFTAEKNRMPAVSLVPDPLGLKLLKLWINNLNTAESCFLDDLETADSAPAATCETL